MGYDIGKFETRGRIEGGVDFQIVHPVEGPAVDDQGNPVTINFSGAESARIKAVVRDRQRSKKSETYKDPKSDDYDFDWLMKEQVADLALLCNGWSSNMTRNGEPFPFTKENAALLFSQSDFLREWGVNKVTDRLNFLPTSSKK